MVLYKYPLSFLFYRYATYTVNSFPVLPLWHSSAYIRLDTGTVDFPAGSRDAGDDCHRRLYCPGGQSIPKS